MKENNTFRKKLQGEPKFNPFNQKFCWEELNKYLEQQKKINEDGTYEEVIALTTQCYNSYYNEIMDYIKGKINNIESSYESIIQTIFAAVNRDYYLLNKKVIKNSSAISVKKIAALEVDSPISHFGTMNVIGTMETQVDISNMIVNILRHSMDNGINELICSPNKFAEVISIYGAANLLHYTKESYDTALWENGYIISKDEQFFIKYIDEEYPIARKVGDIRIKNNILGTLNVLETLANRNMQFSNVYFDENRTKQILNNVYLDNKGNIQYSLKQGKNDFKTEISYAMARTEIDLYYPFITNKTFDSISSLGVNDLLIMFTKISQLIRVINEKMIENIEDVNLKLFSLKANKRYIFQYLKLTTSYKKNQIESFLELIESKSDSHNRIDLWSRPVLNFRNTYYFISSNIIAPNYSFLVDEWLHTAGYDLQERGVDFERYIKSEFRKLLSKRNFQSIIPYKNKFYISKSKYEEIDLLINLKNVVIVGEVKCIKYPMNSRDSNNNLKILRKAAKQIIRKTDYIVNNRNCFKEDIGIIDNKKVIKVIITNYPIYAGTKIEGIPVIDYFLFDSYIRSGKLTHSVIISNDNNEEKNISTTINYYTNEDEFCNNFEEFINKPKSITEIKESLKLETKELTLQNASIKIFQDFVTDND